MPTPITHMVLTEKIYSRAFEEKDRKEIYIGNCFPDIRRVAEIKRTKTHFKNLTMKDLNFIQ